MASFFDQAPLYDNSRSTGSIRDLLLMQGEQRAQAARAAGDNWARTIQGVGNAAAQGIEAYGAHKAEQKQQEQMRANDAATLEAIHTYANDPPKLLEALIRTKGPKDGAQLAETVTKFAKNGQDDNPETHLKTTAASIRTLLKQSPEMQAQLWPSMHPGIQDTVVNRLKQPIQLSDQWTPELAGQLAMGADALDDYLGKKPSAEEKEFEVTVPGPNGEPIKKLVNRETYRAGVEQYVPKEKAAKTAPLGSLEDYVLRKVGPDGTPQQVLAARQEYEAAGRAPKEVKAPEAPAELTLNPEGVVLTGYGTKVREQARTQAKERGIPTFESSALQEKGSKIRSIVLDAQELNGLISDPEVQAAIGPYAGRWTDLKSAVFSLPPNVQRAVQLMGSLTDSELRKRSGASTTEPELKRMLQFATDLKKPLGHNQTAVNGLMTSGARDYKALAGVEPNGYTPVAAAPATAAAGGDLPVVTSETQRLALPPGTSYKTPDGRTKVKK